MAVAALALGGCTKNETVDVADSNVIGFSAFVGNPTKATVTQVTAFFNNEKVYASNGVWAYDNLKQWVAADYEFAAYSNGGSASAVDGKIAIGVTFDGTDLVISDYKVDYEDQRDLVTAVSTSDINATNSPVEFTFDHALAMIKFTLVNGVGKNDIAISGFKIKSVGNTATVTTTTSGATWGATSTVEDLSGADFTSTQATPGVSDEFVVIPQEGTDLVVEFTAKITPDGGAAITKALTATIANYEWEPSFRYNYTATITGTDLDLIEFADPKVTAWDTETPVNEDID